MSKDVTKTALSPARRCLVELMQEVNYGRIERLEVKEREPVFTPPPRLVRQFVFGKDIGPNAKRTVDGFALKKKVVEFVRGSSTGSSRSRFRNS